MTQQELLDLVVSLIDPDDGPRAVNVGRDLWRFMDGGTEDRYSVWISSPENADDRSGIHFSGSTLDGLAAEVARHFEEKKP